MRLSVGTLQQVVLRLRVMIYRKHVRHESPKNLQLDLFTPDDGHFEYYAVATNMPLSLPALYAFIGGRCGQHVEPGITQLLAALDVKAHRATRAAPDGKWSTVQGAEARGGDVAAVPVHGTVR